jgi:4-hydroxybenzoate polyprenyltransferase
LNRARTYLALGRVSNLPTVFSNVLAGAVLSGAALQANAVALMVGSAAAFYTGGMFLNDAFDREIDAKERPQRPIPSGRVSAPEVFGIGFALLALGVVGVAALGALRWGPGGWEPIASGIALAGMIVLYDAWHKGNPLSPLLMGACRVLVYVTAAFALGGQLGAATTGAAVLLCYLIGLTYVAKQENLSAFKNLWPLLFLAAPLALLRVEPVSALLLGMLMLWVLRCVGLLRTRKPGAIPKAVVSLIAGISLLDAFLIARTGAATTALIAALGFPLTLFLQRYVKGT